MKLSNPSTWSTQIQRAALALISVFPGSMPAQEANPFAEVIRSTPWLSPQEELQSFQVPKGFSVQLVASEPQIAKPMNMAIDARGRVWITETVEYPYPVGENETGRDAIKILEDTDGDGSADKITTFAEGLNIPIGILPMEDGAIAFSIPYIYRFYDDDGDDRADRREILYGRLGYERDTHGMTSGFRKGLDGWIYACHGFNNTSTITGADGHSITMNSGNTYRFRPDGSRVEQNTWGQVNPFGLTWDDRGYLYSADCHTFPIYQLISGAYYPSFGKPHDGLGFAPTMMGHLHGSTAIAGVAFYEASAFPEEFHNNLFVGNVMTGRINRDTLNYHGTSPAAQEEKDFLISSDPWFRPVDIQLAPDGSLFVADFYNRVIGHYEAPLDHPGRDRTSGRIWRIVYNNNDEAQSSKSYDIDWTEACIDTLYEGLRSLNATQRRLAREQWLSRVNETELNKLSAALEPEAPTDDRLQTEALWILLQRGHLQSNQIKTGMHSSSGRLREQAFRALGEWSETVDWVTSALSKGLQDNDPFVRRAVVASMAKRPQGIHLESTLNRYLTESKEDTHLIHQYKITLRNQLMTPQGSEELNQISWNDDQSSVLTEICLGFDQPASAAYLISQLKTPGRLPSDDLPAILRKIVRNAPSSSWDEIASIAETRFDGNLEFQYELFESIEQGIQQSGADWTPGLKRWGRRLALGLLRSSIQGRGGWRFEPLEGKAGASANPWGLQTRTFQDAGTGPVLSSIVYGEQLTGKLISKAFPLPEKLEFFVCGHNGYPDANPTPVNRVQLRRLSDNTILRSALPPRNDVGRKVTWEFSNTKAASNGTVGDQVQLEVIDADTGDAYAWIAIGNFSPGPLAIPAVPPRASENRAILGSRISQELLIKGAVPYVAEIFKSKYGRDAEKLAAAQALIAIQKEAGLSTIENVLMSPETSASLKSQLTQALQPLSGSALTHMLLARSLSQASGAWRRSIAETLSSNKSGAAILLSAIQSGGAPAMLLRESSIVSRLQSHQDPNIDQQLKAIASDLPDEDPDLVKLMAARLDLYKSTSGKWSAARGREVFQTNCAVCHQIDGQGALVGPQLDGVWGRGAERLIEDVLMPNRNVDNAFRYSILTLDTGGTANGMLAREEGAAYVLIDATGASKNIPKDEVLEIDTLPTSLMPPVFGETLAEKDFGDLMSYLLQER